MKPVDETWIADGETIRGPNGYLGEMDGQPRAQLAAQAPAMASLLLHLHRSGDPNIVDDIERVLRAAGVIP